MIATNARDRNFSDLPPVSSGFLAGLLSLLAPEACPICQTSTPPVGADRLCDRCSERLPTAVDYCRRCSAPIGPNLRNDDGCGLCRHERYAFATVFAAAEYRDAVRDAVLIAKSAGGRPAAAWLADHIYERHGRELSRLPIDFVLPVPQHWFRRWCVPHNAAELIARRLARRLNAPFRRDILRKVRRTPKQSRLTPSARRENLRAAFAARFGLDGKRLLLVDDVLTTGTTAHRATRALLVAGAETVWVAAAARGIGN